MNKRMKKLTLALSFLLASPTLYATSVDLKGDAAAGQNKSALCGACHGVDGNSLNPLWPRLAGQHASYIVQQLKGFQNEFRQNITMSPMAAPLSEQDMFDLAAYFSSQTKKLGEANPDMVALGEKIYRGGKTGIAACMACHGPQGNGNPAAKYPIVSGQHAQYTHKQLMDYKSGVRKPEGNAIIMRDIALKMSDAEMQAVTDYMQGLY